jgi:hypothetical protein
MTTYGYPKGGTITKAPDAVSEDVDGRRAVIPGGLSVTPGGTEAGAVLLAVQDQANYDITDDSVKPLWVVVPDGTQAGAVSDGKGGWTNPEPGPVVLSPMQFYLAFAPAERVAIKASTLPLVAEFWQTFELAIQTNTTIQTGLQSIVDGVNELVAAKLIDQSRVADILAGVAQ